MEEKIFFKNSDGLKLCGIITKPKVEEILPCVILCHGFDSLKDNTTNKKLSKKLLENHIASLRFDFRGNGESEGSIRTLTLTKCIDDLQSSLNYVKSLEWIDKRKIGLLGNSFSGPTSVFVTSKNKEIKVLVLLSAVSYDSEVREFQLGKDGIRKWKERGFTYLLGYNNRKVKVDYEFYRDSLKYKSYDFADKINIPVLMVHDDKDKVVPINQAKKLFSVLKCKKELKIIKGIAHGVKTKESYDIMTDVIADWFKRWLK